MGKAVALLKGVLLHHDTEFEGSTASPHFSESKGCGRKQQQFSGRRSGLPAMSYPDLCMSSYQERISFKKLSMKYFFCVR
jgi:hypothetical protein